MRALLRLAVADARRHRRRTLASVLLIALPAAAFVAALGLTQSMPTSREAALARLPAGAQAVLTATTVARPGPPLAQAPEGREQWQGATDQVPLDSADLVAALPPGNRLADFWDAADLLFVAGLDARPGEVTAAGDAAGALASVGLEHITRADLREADADALAFLLPPPSTGVAPAGPADLVLSAPLAARLDLTLGDAVTVIAPPSTGWMSTSGRISAVVAGQQKTFRVSGIAPAATERAWAPSGWVSALVAADPAGVDRHHLVLGEAPVPWATVKSLNAEQVITVSRDALEHYPPRSELYPVEVDVQQVLGALATAVVVAAAGGALVIFLVTPAFAVATEQQRRALGLVGAIGGSPRDLARMVTAQGLVVGFLGGLLGALAGAAASLVALHVRTPDADTLTHFPWWSLPVAAVGAALLGRLTTLAPARWAAAQNPVDALRGRSSRPAHVLAGRRWLPPALLALAGAAGAAALAVPPPVADPTGYDPGAPALAVVGLAVAFGAGIAGLLASLRPCLGLLGHLGRHLPLALRTAVRDAERHPTRITPAASAVTVSVWAVSLALVLTGSTVANERDRNLSVVGPDGLVLGAHVPVSDAFDRVVLADASSRLAAVAPVTGSVPVYSYPYGEGRPRIGVGSRVACPADTFPDTRSALEPGAPLRCLPWGRAWTPGMSAAWWLGGEVYVMDAAAVRASRHPDAEEAARVLDAGGVLVSDATRVSDGTATITQVRDDPDGREVTVREDVLPALFVRGFAGTVVLSPQAAERIGRTDAVFVGQIEVTSRPLTPWEVDAARDHLGRQAPLAWVGSGTPAWGSAAMLLPLAGLLVVAVGAAAIAVVLGRAQAGADLATLHALGAPRSFLRRVVAGQASVLLLLGVPLGLGGGLGLGVVWVAWNRHLEVGGAWRQVEFLWSFQALAVVAVVVGAVGLGWLVGRPGRRLAVRSLD